MRWVIGCMVIVCVLVGFVFGQVEEKQVILPSDESATKPKLDKLAIIKPTQGRPIIVKPEQSFYFIFQFKSKGKLDVPQVKAILVSSICPDYKIPLISVSPPVIMQMKHIVMLLKAPVLTPEGVYDLYVDLGIGYQIVPRAVKVVKEFKKKFRFVHLSNMNIGLPTAPDFDERLIDEINLLGPEFIIATGDFFASPEEGDWKRLAEFFAKFNAPCYILCGDMDNIGEYTKYISPNLTDTFDYGGYHFFLMMDTSYRKVEEDKGQLQAIVDDLTLYGKSAIMSFLVGNRESLGIIDGLRAIGKSPEIVFKEGKVRAIICGGSSDWDYHEYADKLKGLEGLEYIRTAQSSTCMKYGGDGVSRYRVIEVNGTELDYIYPAGEEKIQYSIPVGGLRIYRFGANDWTEDTGRVVILNTLRKSFDDCRVIFNLRGRDPKNVYLKNCQKVQVFEGGGGKLTVVAGVNVVERSAIQVLATTNEMVAKRYDKLPVKFDVSLPTKLTFTRRIGSNGITYMQADEKIPFTVRNLSDMSVRVSLQVSISGQAVIIKDPTDPSTIDFTGQEIEIEGNSSKNLMIIPLLKSVSGGKCHLQIYCTNDPLKRLAAFPIVVEVKE